MRVRFWGLGLDLRKPVGGQIVNFDNIFTPLSELLASQIVSTDETELEVY